MSIGIFFFRPWLGGGTSTFTAHLFKAFEAVGQKPVIYRVKERGEEKTRQFGKYDGVVYQNITVDQAKKVVKEMPTVMGSPVGSKYLVRPDLIPMLMNLGMRIVTHDPNEFKIYDHLSNKQRVVSKLPTRPICIRPTMKKFYPEAVFIPHPYMRSGHQWEVLNVKREAKAISVARIASVKRPKIVLEANRLLKTEWRVKLLGAEFRMYTKQLEAKYSDVFKQSGKTFQFPMTFTAPVELCLSAMYNVDMTWFPDDGGGTQYAQMEAMDAGCVNIMHSDWLRFHGELRRGKHLLTINSHQELAATLALGLSGHEDHSGIVEHGYKLLSQHSPKIVGQLYMEELNR